ncbi:MAG: response regulator transcription factor [Erysipelotrichaceae bacterium]|nr:response regulator transcription factor [Erysipelotrichaceae bacterium]
MIKIAIVDDNEEQISSIKEAILEYGKSNNLSFNIDYYKSAFAIDKKDSDYSIIFLDIQMPGIDGMSYAREVRKRNESVVICFTTSFAQYAVKGYEVDAVDYILKPIVKSEFLTKFPRILRYAVHDDDEKKIRIKTKDGTRIVNINDIIYVEAYGHTLFYYLSSNEKLESRYSLKELEKILTVDSGFARCNAAYLVNLRQVKNVKGNDVLMNNGNNLPISQGKRKSFIIALTNI